jgi:ABC-type bacteriocin/lantibiotic exporter with double-glycine peptidase domain
MPLVILPVPHRQQQAYGECLAACADMILHYLGFSISYKRLLKLLRVKPLAGTRSSNIRELKKLGFSVIYEQGTFDKLYHHLSNDRPCIAFVKTGELPYWDDDTDHAVVVVGLDDNNVFINDPEFPDAPMQVSRGHFDLAWVERDDFYAVIMRRS